MSWLCSIHYFGFSHGSFSHITAQEEASPSSRRRLESSSRKSEKELDTQELDAQNQEPPEPVEPE